jgi:hypothetical protein
MDEDHFGNLTAEHATFHPLLPPDWCCRTGSSLHQQEVT